MVAGAVHGERSRVSSGAGREPEDDASPGSTALDAQYRFAACGWFGFFDRSMLPGEACSGRPGDPDPSELHHQLQTARLLATGRQTKACQERHREPDIHARADDP